jgi:hypothetical protein
LATSVVDKRRDSFDVYIGRGSKWGNPFIIGIHGSRQEVIELYRQYVEEHENLMNSIPELCGKVLGCYCKPLACHGDVLAEMANELETSLPGETP